MANKTPFNNKKLGLIPKLLFFWLISMCSVSAQQLQFLKTQYHFDTLQEGQIFRHRFLFEKIGAGRQSIAYVSSSCDCATPIWPHSPLVQGDTGSIKVEFQTKGKLGLVEKYFTVYDSLRQPIGRLSIGGFIKPKTATASIAPTTFEWRQDMAYNEVEPSLTLPEIDQFITQARLQRPGRIAIAIEASASQVPTAEFETNQALAEERARLMQAELQQKLRVAGFLGKAVIIARDERVQGPAFKINLAPASFAPYQYVRVKARFEAKP